MLRSGVSHGAIIPTVTPHLARRINFRTSTRLIRFSATPPVAPNTTPSGIPKSAKLIIMRTVLRGIGRVDGGAVTAMLALFY